MKKLPVQPNTKKERSVRLGIPIVSCLPGRSTQQLVKLALTSLPSHHCGHDGGWVPGRQRAAGHVILTVYGGERRRVSNTSVIRALHPGPWKRAWHFIIGFTVLNVVKNIVSSSLKSHKSRTATGNPHVISSGLCAKGSQIQLCFSLGESELGR